MPGFFHARTTANALRRSLLAGDAFICANPESREKSLARQRASTLHDGNQRSPVSARAITMRWISLVPS